MFKDTYTSGFSPVWQDLSGKFGCPVLSGQEAYMPSPVEPYWVVVTKREIFQALNDEKVENNASLLHWPLTYFVGKEKQWYFFIIKSQKFYNKDPYESR